MNNMQHLSSGASKPIWKFIRSTNFILLNFFLTLAFLAQSCTGSYAKNHFDLTSLQATCDSSNEDLVHVTFGVEYYTDSTLHQGVVMGSMEEGQDGSDYAIRYFGFAGPFVYGSAGDSTYETMDEFRSNFNVKERSHAGESIKQEYILYSSKACGPNIQSLIMVLENTKSGQIDTLFANR